MISDLFLGEVSEAEKEGRRVKLGNSTRTNLRGAETKQNETKQNDTKRNDTKRNKK